MSPADIGHIFERGDIQCDTRHHGIMEMSTTSNAAILPNLVNVPSAMLAQLRGTL